MVHRDQAEEVVVGLGHGLRRPVLVDGADLELLEVAAVGVGAGRLALGLVGGELVRLLAHLLRILLWFWDGADAIPATRSATPQRRAQPQSQRSSARAIHSLRTSPGSARDAAPPQPAGADIEESIMGLVLEAEQLMKPLGGVLASGDALQKPLGVVVVLGSRPLAQGLAASGISRRNARSTASETATLAYSGSSSCSPGGDLCDFEELDRVVMPSARSCGEHCWLRPADRGVTSRLRKEPWHQCLPTSARPFRGWRVPLACAGAGQSGPTRRPRRRWHGCLSKP